MFRMPSGLKEESEIQPRLLYDNHVDPGRGPRLSVVTLNECAGPVLIRLLNSLAEQTCDPRDMEMLIMEAGGTKDDLGALHAVRLPFRLRYYGPPEAALRSGVIRRAGVRAAAGTLVLFLGSDMIASPRLVQDHLERHGRGRGRLAVIGDIDHSQVRPGEFQDRLGCDTRPEKTGAFLGRWVKRAHLLPWYYRFWRKHPGMVFSTGNASARRDDLLAVPDLENADSDQDVGSRLERSGFRFRWTRRSLTWVQKEAGRGQVDRYTLEIDITYRCTLRCGNCNRSTGVAPSHPGQDITLEQIEKWIRQSRDQRYPWKRLRIIGGEPTVHPQFEVILHLLAAYRKEHNPGLVIEVFSNGATAETGRKLAWVQLTFPDILVVNSKKYSNRQASFVLVHQAPADRPGALDYVYQGCRLPLVCGMNFNYSGFYCCSPGSAIARVFGLDIAMKDIGAISDAGLKRMFGTLCPLCGHFDPRVAGRHPGPDTISPSWQKALERYHCAQDEVALARY